MILTNISPLHTRLLQTRLLQSSEEALYAEGNYQLISYSTVIKNSRLSFASFCGVPAFTFLIYYFAASIFVKARPTDPLQ